jgi:uncharacterized protein involved in exopolysaccharide biosynthesis
MSMKKFLMRSPSQDDFIHLLAAWRFWIAGAVIGAVVAGILYLVVPPQYRAQATVLVDQNVEQVIPQEESDLLRFNYLARETDKLIAIAWSDQTLALVHEKTGLSLAQLRDGRLLLSQPADATWHFLADASTPSDASSLAIAWAAAFVQELQSKPAGVSPLLDINFTRQQDIPVARTVPLGAVVFVGALLGALVLAFFLLFFDRKEA